MCSQSDANRLQGLVWILILSRHKTPMKKQRILLTSQPTSFPRSSRNEVANLVPRAFSALLFQDGGNGGAW